MPDKPNLRVKFGVHKFTDAVGANQTRDFRTNGLHDFVSRGETGTIILEFGEKREIRLGLVLTGQLKFDLLQIQRVLLSSGTGGVGAQPLHPIVWTSLA